MILDTSLCLSDHLGLFMVDLGTESLVQETNLLLCLTSDSLLLCTSDILTDKELFLSSDTKCLVVFLGKGIVLLLTLLLLLYLSQLLHLDLLVSFEVGSSEIFLFQFIVDGLTLLIHRQRIMSNRLWTSSANVDADSPE